jgi:hypothetical protein
MLPRCPSDVYSQPFPPHLPNSSPASPSPTNRKRHAGLVKQRMACEKKIRQRQTEKEKATPALMRLREEASRLTRRIKGSEKAVEAARREAAEQEETLARVEADLKKLRAAKVRL